MAQLQKKFIANNAVGATKIRLENNAYLRARNAADSADVNIIKVNASNALEFASVPQVSADPTNANDLVRKSYLESYVGSQLEGLKPKQAVRAATTANITLSGAQTIDTVSVVAGNRVLVKNQTDAKENGIYVAASGAWSRSTDFDSTSPIDEVNGAYTFIQEGSQAGQGWVQTGTVTTIGTDNINFVYFNSVAGVTGGDMITVTGGSISVDLATVSGLESTNPGNAAGQLRVKLEASNPTLKIDGSNQLGVKYDTAAGLNTSANGLQVNVGNGLAFNAGAIDVQVDNSTIELNSDQLRIKDDGVTAAKLNADVAGDGIKQEVSGALSVDSNREVLTLSGTDITNQYKDLAFEAIPASVQVVVIGGPQQEFNVDYTLSVASGKTRITFAGDLATGGAAELVSGDKLQVYYLIK